MTAKAKRKRSRIPCLLALRKAFLRGEIDRAQYKAGYEYRLLYEFAPDQFAEIQEQLVENGAYVATVTESLVLRDSDQMPSHIGYARDGLAFLATRLKVTGKENVPA